jgi:hypothetical protein
MAIARREKHFGEGRSIPLDRNAKARVLMLAQSFLHRMADGTEKPAGKAYGALTAKHLDVLRALLLGFHNGKSGRCFPSYEAAMDRAGCARSTVYLAIQALEKLGILTWVNRMFRARVVDVSGTDLLGHTLTRIRIMRTSNAYTFADPNPGGFVERFTKSEKPTGTPIPLLISSAVAVDPALAASLDRLKRAMTGASRAGS